MEEKLKLNHLDGYFAKKMWCAEVNMMKGLLEDAAKEAEYVRAKRSEIIQPPHIQYTRSVYQVGKVQMLLGEQFKRNGNRGTLHDFKVVILTFKVNFPNFRSCCKWHNYFVPCI